MEKKTITDLAVEWSSCQDPQAQGVLGDNCIDIEVDIGSYCSAILYLDKYGQIYGSDLKTQKTQIDTRELMGLLSRVDGVRASWVYWLRDSIKDFMDYSFDDFLPAIHRFMNLLKGSTFKDVAFLQTNQAEIVIAFRCLPVQLKAQTILILREFGLRLEYDELSNTLTVFYPFS